LAVDAGFTADDTENEGKKRDYTEVLEEANERFASCVDRDRDNRDNAKSDTEFVYLAGKQTPDKMKADLLAADDPCLEFPQLKQFVNQVVNEQRQNRPGIRVHPAGGKASDKVAEILQGMVRHIEYDSNAEAAYDGGFQHAVVGGRGYWRVTSEYESGNTFNQKLCIKRIPDPQTVYFDLDFQEPDGSDANFCFVTENVEKDAFEKRWPKAEALSWTPSEDTNAWYEGKDTVIVADYYRRVCKKRTLVAMSDGAVGWKDEMPHGIQLPPGVMIVREREADDYHIEWLKLAGGEQVLEEYDCPGKLLPVVCCMGDEIMIDGKRIFQGLIRQARDSQIMYNFSQNMKLALLAASPRSPFIGSAEAIEGYEDQWKNANKRSYGILAYNLRDGDGEPIPMPQRTQPPQIPTGWAEAAAQNKDDIKSVIGMYQNSLGQHAGETSGRAILAREKQGDNATFHFADNLARAIALTGKIIVGMVPTYYDTQRLVQMVGVDDERSTAVVNEQQPAPDDPYSTVVMNDLSVGQYAVVVEAGPSYATKQEETRESLMALVQADPQILQIAGDIIVNNMDFPDADKLSKRMKLMLPPPIQQSIAQEENPDGPPPLPPEVQQQMQEMQQQLEQAGQMVQQLQGELQQAQAGTDADMAKAQAAAELAQQKAASDAALAQQKAETEAQLAEYKAQLDANTRVQVARISAETDLQIAGMQAPPELMAAPGNPTAEQGNPQIEQLMQMMERVHQAVGAPRQHQPIMDDAGNIKYVISGPAQTIQ
jgi:hypothetical protein